MEIERHLREEVDTQLGYLGGVDANTEEYKMRVGNLTPLLDRVIEMEKLAREHEDRLKQAEEECKSRKWQNGLKIAGIIIEIGMTLTVLNYDKKGVILASPVSKLWMNKNFNKR